MSKKTLNESVLSGSTVAPKIFTSYPAILYTVLD